MINSMTGFGKSVVQTTNTKYTIEVRSLNSKGIDLNIKVSSQFREKEAEIRSLLANELKRGKIDFSLYCENIGGSTKQNINKEVFINYYNQLKEIAEATDTKNTDYISIISRFPDVMSQSSEEVNEEEWQQIYEGCIAAVKQLQNHREEEGKTIEKEFVEKVNYIADLLEKVKPYETERIEEVKKRISTSIEKLKLEVDENRFEQEIIYYLEKIDFSEEKSRLSAHCKYFIEVMNNENNQGKKLGFITQEMGREINTLGSKANHSEIQKIVVEMKDELEKIKEQIGNVL